MSIDSQPIIITPELLLERSIEAAESVYPALAVRWGETFGLTVESIHQAGICHVWTPAASRAVNTELRLVGERPLVGSREAIPSSDSVLFHRYVTLELTGLDGTQILDGTWQQLLAEDERSSSDLPRVLAGTSAEVIEIALAAGVPEELAMVWDLTHPKNITL